MWGRISATLALVFVVSVPAVQSDVQRTCATSGNIGGRCAHTTTDNLTVMERRTLTSTPRTSGRGHAHGESPQDYTAGTGGNANVRAERLAEPRYACHSGQRQAHPTVPQACIDSEGEPTENPLPAEPGPAQADAPRTIIAADLVSLAPRPTLPVTEPQGWGIVGKEVNLTAPTGAQIVEGVLFDAPVRVRFIPVRWVWTWGDGEQSTSTTGGATWAAQSLPEFSVTPTSHRYSREGRYEVSVRIAYAAEIKTPDGWAVVDGSIIGPASTTQVTVVRTGSVLVEERTGGG